jgi:hypothetical protein
VCCPPDRQVLHPVTKMTHQCFVSSCQQYVVVTNTLNKHTEQSSRPPCATVPCHVSTKGNNPRFKSDVGKLTQLANQCGYVLSVSLLLSRCIRCTSSSDVQHTSMPAADSKARHGPRQTHVRALRRHKKKVCWRRPASAWGCVMLAGNCATWLAHTLV